MIDLNKIMTKYDNLKNSIYNFYSKNRNLGRKKKIGMFLELGAPERSLNRWLVLLVQNKDNHILYFIIFFNFSFKFFIISICTLIV